MYLGFASLTTVISYWSMVIGSAWKSGHWSLVNGHWECSEGQALVS